MTDALAWALVHFLWQGLALGAACWGLLRVVRTPQARYAIGVATLAAMPVVFGWTATVQMRMADEPAGVISVASSPADVMADDAAVAAPITAVRGFELPSEWLVALWLLGVSLLAARAAGGWMLARRLTRIDVSPVSDAVVAVARHLSGDLGITRVVRVLASARVGAPMMVGWIAPVILVPTTALTGLSAAQLEAVLAHELAHIRRHDYLVNLCQVAIETVFFFHPIVWWISRRVRDERELCCDDLALAVTDRVTYATALSTLARLRPAALALGATGGSLTDRIRRIITPRPASESPRGGWMAMLPIMFVLSLTVPSASTVTLPQVPSPVETIVTTAPEVMPPGNQSQVVIRAESTPEEAPAVAALLREQLAELQPPPPAQSTPFVAEQTLAERQRALERARAELATEEVLSVLQAEVRAKQQAFERLAALAERNLVTSDQILTAEAELSIATASLARAQKQRELDLEALELEQEKTIAAKQMEMAALSTRVGAEHPMRIALQRELDALMAGSPTPLGQTSAPKPGDVVTIAVPGAPALAGEWVVQPDGTLKRKGDAQPTPEGEMVFVNGEVNAAGQKAWQPGMTVNKALSLAGGMTVRGKLGYVRRKVVEADGRVRYVKIDTLSSNFVLEPDDELYVVRRWFGGL